jgi:hypothetical protein
MSATTKRWGVRGAVSLAAVGGFLVLWQFCDGGNEALNIVLWSGVCLPVSWVWDTLIRQLGMQGDQGMVFILPIYASAIAYLACLGFALGAVLGWLLAPDEKKG